MTLGISSLTNRVQIFGAFQLVLLSFIFNLVALRSVNILCNLLRFIKVYFMDQHVVYFGERFMHLEKTEYPAIVRVRQSSQCC